MAKAKDKKKSEVSIDEAIGLSAGEPQVEVSKVESSLEKSSDENNDYAKHPKFSKFNLKGSN